MTELELHLEIMRQRAEQLAKNTAELNEVLAREAIHDAT